jgi:hypothetical protein
MAALLGDDAAAVRWAALIVLGALGRRRAAPMRVAVLAQLEDPNASTRIRLAALKALRGLGPVGGAERDLIVRFLFDPTCAASALRLLQLAGATVGAYQEHFRQCQQHLSRPYPYDSDEFHLWPPIAERFAHLASWAQPDTPLAHCPSCSTSMRTRRCCVLPLAIAARYVGFWGSGIFLDSIFLEINLSRIARKTLTRITIKLRKLRQAKGMFLPQNSNNEVRTVFYKGILQKLSKNKARKIHNLEMLQQEWQIVASFDRAGCQKICERDPRTVFDR